MKRLSIIVLLSIYIILSLGAQGTREVQKEEKPLSIMVSILPHKFVVERIAGPFATVEVLVGEGQSPHAYEPTPRQMLALSHAHAWITSSIDFELALGPKISALYPKLLQVEGTKGVSFRSLEEHSHDDDDEEDHHHHHDIRLDRHTWLGKEPMKIFATIAYETLTLLDNHNEAFYKDNLTAFLNEVDLVFAHLKEDLAPLKGATVFVYHPAFGYFFDEFSIHQEAVETGGKEPTAKTLSSLIEKGRAYNAKAIFVQAQFPTQAAKTVAEALNAQVVALNPLAYNWLENIKAMGDALIASLSK